MRNKILNFGISGILILFFMSITVQQDEPVFENCSVKNNAFVQGESLTYKLYYNWGYLWMSAGEVKFSVEDLGDEYYVKAVGRTYGSFDWFFKVRDVYEAYLDKETLLPNVTIRSVKEGGYTLYDKLVFDREKGKVTSYRGNFATDAKSTVYDIENCTSEMLSMIYYIRNVTFNEFDKGAEFPVQIFMDKEKWDLSMTYGGVENKKISGLGKKRVHKCSPQVISGDVFEDGAKIDIFVSTDGNQIPYLVELPLSVGVGKAILQKSSGLRH